MVQFMFWKQQIFKKKGSLPSKRDYNVLHNESSFSLLRRGSRKHQGQCNFPRSEWTNSTQGKQSLSSSSNDSNHRPTLNLIASNLAYECGSVSEVPHQVSPAYCPRESFTTVQKDAVPQVISFKDIPVSNKNGTIPQSVLQSPSIGFLTMEYESNYEEIESFSTHLNVKTPRMGASEKACIPSNSYSVGYPNSSRSESKHGTLRRLSTVFDKQYPKLKPSEMDIAGSYLHERSRTGNNESYTGSQKDRLHLKDDQHHSKEIIGITDPSFGQERKLKRDERSSEVKTTNAHRIIRSDKPQNFSLLASPVLKKENHTVNVELSDWSLENAKSMRADETSFVTAFEKVAPELIADCEWVPFEADVAFVGIQPRARCENNDDNTGKADLARLTNQIGLLLNRVTSLERAVLAGRIEGHNSTLMDQTILPAQDTAFVAEEGEKMDNSAAKSKSKAMFVLRTSFRFPFSRF